MGKEIDWIAHVRGKAGALAGANVVVIKSSRGHICS